MSDSSRRVLVVGLDGMTYAVMKPLAEQGIMPTCKSLMERGTWGDLMSTIPPVTGPAWCSFATGKQPGNHGVFDFFKPTRGRNAVGMSRRLINSKEVDGKTIWQILSELGKTCIVMNVPVSYPPRPIKGALFTGMLTPSVDGDLTYPPDLYQRLKPELGEYCITVNWQGYSDSTVRDFLRDLGHCQKRRTEYCLRLMDEYPDWEFCFPCYTGTDRIQHAMWHYIDPVEREKIKAEGRYEEDIMQMVLDFYRQVDDEIAQLLEKAGPETAVFFVSDHGFGPMRGKFYVNEFLEQQGLLSVKRGKVRQAMVSLLARKVYHKALKTLGQKERLKRIREKAAADRQKEDTRTFYDVFYESIDWENTKVYMASNTEGGLYLNVKGRKLYGQEVDHGIIDPADYLAERQRVMDALRQIKHPDTGESMLSHVMPREEVYSGQYIERAPDIVFFLESGAWVADFSLGKGLYKRADWRTGSGMHRMEGCFLACGAGIAQRDAIETSIINVVPTILAYMGYPIPTDMDGRFIEEAFTDEWKASHEVSYSGDASETGKGWGHGKDVYDDDDEEVLVERLRGLGYID